MAETSNMILYNECLNLYVDSMKSMLNGVDYFYEVQLMDIHTSHKIEAIEKVWCLHTCEFQRNVMKSMNFPKIVQQQTKTRWQSIGIQILSFARRRYWKEFSLIQRNQRRETQTLYCKSKDKFDSI